MLPCPISLFLKGIRLEQGGGHFLHLKPKFKIIAPSSYFSDNKTWKKKTTDSCFDVTMGSFDGAERCEQVGLYIQLKLEKYFQNQTLDYTEAMD